MTPTPAPMPMPALAPALREDDEDALVLVVEGRILFVVPACWFVEDRPPDDKPADDRPVDDKPLDDGSVVYFSSNAIVSHMEVMYGKSS